MQLSLSGKRAIVCGASQGIGKATALELAQLGAAVTLIARNETKLSALVDELVSINQQNHCYLVCDFNDSDLLEKTVRSHVKEHPAQILVNNTGGPPGGPIIEAKDAAFLAAFNQHLLCNHKMVQSLLAGMKDAAYGRIINVISTSVKEPIPGLGVSNSIRGAVSAWAKTLSVELGAFGITVNNVLPGFTDTTRLTEIIKNKADASGQSNDDVVQLMKSYVPLGRFARAEETANVIAFLASPAAAYVNGVNLPVDGGRTRSL